MARKDYSKAEILELAKRPRENLSKHQRSLVDNSPKIKERGENFKIKEREKASKQRLKEKEKKAREAVRTQKRAEIKKSLLLHRSTSAQKTSSTSRRSIQPKVTRPGILSSLPGFHRNSNGSYTNERGQTISKYQATQVAKGKKTLDEATYKFKHVDVGFTKVKARTFQVKTIEEAKAIAKEKRFSHGELLVMRIGGRAHLRYEGESRKGTQFRSISSTAASTYDKDAYWEYVHEQTDTQFIGEATSYTLIFLEKEQK